MFIDQVAFFVLLLGAHILISVFWTFTLIMRRSLRSKQKQIHSTEGQSLRHPFLGHHWSSDV